MARASRKVCFPKSEYVLYKPYPGLHLAYHAKRFLFSARSQYQQIDVIENDAYGRMLLLDGNIQHTEYDSRIFNEALCNTVKGNVCSRVLVLGGGSGQTAMSLLESPTIEHITLVEIDPTLIECCRKYVQGVRRAFADPRVRILVGDAFKHLHSTHEQFDAAIIDLTERPFRIRSNSKTLHRLYADIKEKCRGRCSQYIGSSVDLAGNTRFREAAIRASGMQLTNIRYEDVFIPSFGAPHTFMHAGYSKRPDRGSPEPR
jgi:predicted membrane-bound spermidine synthase